MSCDGETWDWIFDAANAVINTAGFIGMVSSTLLLYACLRRGSQQSILGRLVASLASVDLLVNLWFFVPSWIVNRSLVQEPVVHGCYWWWPVLRCLQLWSMALGAAIAFAILLAVLKLSSWLHFLRFAPIISLPVAALLGLGYMINPQQYYYEHVKGHHPHCGTNDDTSQTVFASELLVIVILIGGVHVIGLISVRKHSPLSVVKRAFRSASRFMAAFLAAWLPCFIYIIVTFISPTSADNSCAMLVLVRLQDLFSSLGGLFNYLAYKGVGFTESSQRVVAFEEVESLWTAPQPGASEQLAQGGDEWKMLWSVHTHGASEFRAHASLMGARTESSILTAMGVNSWTRRTSERPSAP